MSDPQPTASPTSSRPARGRRRIFGLLILLAIAGTLLYGNIRWPTPPEDGTALSAPAPRNAGKTVRLASYNIHGGVGQDGRRDLARVAADLKGFDLIALNEVRGQGQVADLGHQLSLPHLFAPAERRWWHDSFGNAVLAAIPVTSWSRVPLPGTSSSDFRNTLLLRTTLDGKPLNVLSTHVTRKADHGQQLATVIDRFLELSRPAILMGDLNTLADDPQFRSRIDGRDITDALSNRRGTTPCVDWILVRGLRVRDAGLVNSGNSDHPLVWAEVGAE